MSKRLKRLDQARALWFAQDQKCANPTCRAPILPYGRGRALHISSRGLPLAMLCKSCWTALALLQFDRKRVLGAALYLRRLKKK